MRRDQRHNRPWQRKSTSAPAAVYREMHHRRLDDLTACRTAWEQASDPLALCVAVDNADLPEWLVDALLPLLMDDSGGLLKSLWRQRRRDMIDAWRAVQVTRARGGADGTPKFSLEEAYRSAAIGEAEADIPSISSRAARDAYERVAPSSPLSIRRYRPSWEHIINDARIITPSNIARCCIQWSRGVDAADV